jgi:hypothetical protein
MKTDLETLVGMRFSSLDSIADVLKKTFGAIDPRVFESESERLESQDFCLDASLDSRAEDGDYEDFVLWYLKDNDNNYYITEVNIL